MIKAGKKISISNPNYKIFFGNVDDTNSNNIYLSLSSWLEPKDIDTMTNNRIIKNLNKKVKQSIFNLLNSNEDSIFDKNRTIIDMDIRESGVRLGKRSFMNCEVSLFLNKKLFIKSKEINDNMLSMIDYIIEDIFSKEKHFSFHKTKK